LLRALVARTSVLIDAERNALFDHLETSASPVTMRSVLEALVSPMSSRLRTPEGRRHFRLLGQIAQNPRYVADASDLMLYSSSTARGAQLLRPFVPRVPTAVAVLRGRLVVGLLIRAYADQARMMELDPAPALLLGVEEFTTSVVDTVMGMLQAPVTQAS
jgi:hypothetical protein